MPAPSSSSSTSSDTDAPPAFDSLRSKFEKMATVSSPPGPPRTPVPREVASMSNLSKSTLSPALAVDEFGVFGSVPMSGRTPSAEFKATKRPPPPPPRPSKASSPPLTNLPIAARPTAVTVTSSPSLQSHGGAHADKASLIARKPPPPPSLTFSESPESESSLVQSGSVASIKSKFGALNGNSAPALPSTRPQPSPQRVTSLLVSAAAPDLPARPQTGSVNSRHRHSMGGPPALPTVPRPTVKVSNDEVGSPQRKQPPPLPARSRESTSSLSPSSSLSAIEAACKASKSALNGSPESSSSAENGIILVNTSDTVLTNSPPPIPKRPQTTVPPPPPPRRQASFSQLSQYSVDTSVSSSSEPTSTHSTPTLQVPPPLPVRRNTPPQDLMSAPPSSTLQPPAIPPRPASAADFNAHANATPLAPASAPPVPERKALGSGIIAPPPTRTIALGDKLPAPRRTASVEGSSDDYSDDEDTSSLRAKGFDMLPDATLSSRRPPTDPTSLFANFKPAVASHHGAFAAAGNFFVTSHHHIRIFDVTVSISTPMHTLDFKDLLEWRVKDPRVTAMEFRPSADPESKGCIFWIGTKDGQIGELDVRSGRILAVRPVHGYTVTNIWRVGSCMVSLDESGKALVFEPAPGTTDINLMSSQPHVLRIIDKGGFARLFGRYLWTSSGLSTTGSGHQHHHHYSMNGSTSSLVKGPTIRIYDVFSPNGSFVTVTGPESVVGATVTAGAVLPTQPHKVYLGHAGGYISVWDTQTPDGLPVCVDVVKVSVSDILCLEGVNDRLWAGGRNGVITAYDPEHAPWLVTNSWVAHGDLPVQSIVADPWSIEKCGLLNVISVGRDEQARFWDGLFGADWIDASLSQREASFCSYRPLNVLVVSWNVDTAKPDTLIGCEPNLYFLEQALTSVDSPDIIEFGFQELINLESKRMAAKGLLHGGKKRAADGTLSEKVSRSYKMWHDHLVRAVRLAMPPDCPYEVVREDSLVGLFSILFVKSELRSMIKNHDIQTIKRGMGGRYGNKGGVVARLVIDDSSICFINCHLAAGHTHVRQRNADVAGILEEKAIFPHPHVDPHVFAGGGDGSMVLDHEFVFLHGDLNYRIDQQREKVITAVHQNNIPYLLQHDQLLKEMKNNRGFRLRSFIEAPITFAPTYKYDRRSSMYDTSEKGRIPAWCDRVLFRCRQPARVESLHYRRYEANVSDHRPISAGFRITVKSVNRDLMLQAQLELQEAWDAEIYKRLMTAHQFYVAQELA